MNRRNVLVICLLVFLVVLIAINFWPPDGPPPPAQKVVVAARDIEPFTVITSTMTMVITATTDIKAETIKESLESYAVHDAGGEVCMKMARQPIKANQPILRSVLLDKCFKKQPEIISLPARFSEMVGGQLKPLHLINIWGYHAGSQSLEDMILIASNVLVVDVRTVRGEDAALSLSTPGGSGGLGLGGVGEGTEPASIVTVAAEPGEVQRIISYLGAQGFQAWVTLTGEDVWDPPTVTPTPTPSTLAPTATSTPTPSTLTPTATPTPRPMPDLVVLSITTDPSPMIVDQLGTIRVEVKNQGLADIVTSECWVGLYIDRPAKAEPDEQMFCPPLSVNGSAVISYTITLADVGYHALTAWVDWLGAIAEENEANNQYSASIFVEPPPTATPTPTPTSTPTSTPTPTPTVDGKGPVIDLSLENTPYQWQLDVVFDDGVNMVSAVSAEEIRAAGVAYRRVFQTRELTLTVTNMYPSGDDVWIIRTDKDEHAEVFLYGHSKDEEGRDMFEWGKEGTVVIRLVKGATEAVVTLLDLVVGAGG